MNANRERGPLPALGPMWAWLVDTLFPAFVATAWTLPIAGTVHTVSAVLGFEVPGFSFHNSVAYGSVLGLLTWVIVSIAYIPLTTPSRANSNSYYELSGRIERLANLRKSEFTDTAERLRHDLNTRGLRWIWATGYVDLWQRLHRAEEELILQASVPQLAGIVFEDQMRLDGAKGISGTLNRVLACVAGYLELRCVEVANPPATARPAAPVAEFERPADDDEARQVVRGVRFAINDFRDQTWAGLIGLRNQTLSAKAETTAVVAGVAFFLVAATVGLVNRLYVLSQSDTAVDDYGLSNARLILVPTLSGLAGLGGVFLSGLVFSPAFSSLLQPHMASSVGRTVAAQLPPLAEIFNVDTNPAGLLFALVFGFAPVLLIASLQDLGDKYKKAIASTELTPPPSVT